MALEATPVNTHITTLRSTSIHRTSLTNIESHNMIKANEAKERLERRKDGRMGIGQVSLTKLNQWTKGKGKRRERERERKNGSTHQRPSRPIWEVSRPLDQISISLTPIIHCCAAPALPSWEEEEERRRCGRAAQHENKKKKEEQQQRRRREGMQPSLRRLVGSRGWMSEGGDGGGCSRHRDQHVDPSQPPVSPC
jgi:hypothetical protein